MSAMVDKGITELNLEEKTGFKLRIARKEEAPVHSHSYAPPAYHEPRFVPPPSYKHPVPEHVVEEKKEATKAEGKYVKSPMVGTFYSTPSPGEPAFIKVGDRVDENTVVCIIEAMKVMNEVKAGVSGVVAEICVENGHPLEFGTKIFRIT